MIVDQFTVVGSPHISLHYGDPGPYGLMCEVEFDGYQRVPVALVPSLPVHDPVFEVRSSEVQIRGDREVVIAHICLWDRGDGGRLLGIERLSAPVTLPPGGTFCVGSLPSQRKAELEHESNRPAPSRAGFIKRRQLRLRKPPHVGTESA